MRNTGPVDGRADFGVVADDAVVVAVSAAVASFATSSAATPSIRASRDVSARAGKMRFLKPRDRTTFVAALEPRWPGMYVRAKEGQCL
jgi:hypothetical protein